jgi:hypothetical protein
MVGLLHSRVGIHETATVTADDLTPLCPARGKDDGGIIDSAVIAGDRFRHRLDSSEILERSPGEQLLAFESEHVRSMASAMVATRKKTC